MITEGLSRRNPNEGKKDYSIIHWQTGAPEEEWCSCLVTTKHGQVSIAMWLQERGWMSSNLLHRHKEVIAWCKLSDIEPYKKETK